MIEDQMILHTVMANGRTYDFHILPSGMISNKCLNVIGNGVVFNLDAFFSELEKNGITSDLPGWEKRIFISNRAHIVFSVHMQVDGRQEDTLDVKAKIGTTKKGIGPTYSSKCFRNGIRMADLMSEEFDEFESRFRTLNAHYKKQFPSVEINEDAELSKLKEQATELKRLGIVVDTAFLLNRFRNEEKNILVEGANGALLDLDFGTYPYVTSSNATVGGACTGLGIPPTAIKKIFGVVKAYQTRVGEGPFPTEQLNSIGEKLQTIGREFGVTTGRKRRCGWLDLFLLKHATIVNGFTVFALTKLDILDTFEHIDVAISYKLEDRVLETPPARAADWNRVQVDYKRFPGWMTDTSNIRSYNELPDACKNYIQFIEHFINVPIKYIGVGQTREALIVRTVNDEKQNSISKK